MGSILEDIKKMLGVDKLDDHFDTDIILHVNSVFSILTQMGIGPTSGFSITDERTTWNDFLGTDPGLQMAKSYIYLKVKLLFDPPLSSSVIESMNRYITELEWRMISAVETVETVETV